MKVITWWCIGFSMKYSFHREDKLGYTDILELVSQALGPNCSGPNFPEPHLPGTVHGGWLCRACAELIFLPVVIFFPWWGRCLVVGGLH